LHNQPTNDDRIENPANAASAGGDSSRETASGRKVRAYKRDGGREQASGSKANAKALGEKDLVVLGAQGGHHHSKHLEKDTQRQQWEEVSSIECTSTQNPNKQQQKPLNGTDP
jgi:hypothetical protein